MVPGKLQMVGEAGYDFIRKGIVYEALGKKEGDKYVPLMVSLFFFIWIMNLWSIVPVAQFPVTSIIAYPAGLALLVYLIWVPLTFKRHGFVGGFKNITGYNKELGWVLPLVMVLELFSNLLIRPFTHAVRSLREHVRRPRPAADLHHRQLVPAERHRHRLRRRLLRDGHPADRLRDVHPGPFRRTSSSSWPARTSRALSPSTTEQSAPTDPQTSGVANPHRSVKEKEETACPLRSRPLPTAFP
ncbi:hypothetical protein GCM10020221_06420 [Streptomyces thioluteus]|uniref:ATP synthase subunit a n=1 Tax=Streptomyces thioluteus TaxID=66431 RepID=A0ABN3WH59_STRTU